jgi:hypothetical protein
MRGIGRHCFKGTTIEQQFLDGNNSNEVIEQTNDEYDCIGKIGDETCLVGYHGYRIQNSSIYKYFIGTSQ